MPDEYNDQLKSKIADIQNIGTRYGGAITAALFLQNFVSKDTSRNSYQSLACSVLVPSATLKLQGTRQLSDPLGGLHAPGKGLS